MRKVIAFLLVVFSVAVGLAATNEVVVSQCWAMTKSGNRCKRRAVPNERYCKQHSADRAPSKVPDRCRSMTTNGVQCSRAPLPNRNYCKEHLK